MTRGPVQPTPDAGEDLRYVFVERVKCPKPNCRSANVTSYGTMAPETDGTQRRYTICRSCGWRFITILE